MMLINGLEKKFWIVIDPMPNNNTSLIADDITLDDIWYETDYTGLMMMSRGGLDPLDIMGVFKGKRVSKTYAKKALAEAQQAAKR